MDITPAFNTLLGRPWIHSAGAVPSTLHQKLYEIHSGQSFGDCPRRGGLCCLQGPSHSLCRCWQWTVRAVLSVPIVCFFSLCCWRSTYPSLSQAGKAIAQIMLSGNFKPGCGLGRNLQGMPKPVKLPKADERFWLGFETSKTDRHDALLFSRRRREGWLWPTC